MQVSLQTIAALGALLSAGCAASPAPAPAAAYGLEGERTIRSRRARTTVHLAELGPRSSRSAIVLLHPWAASLRIWQQVAPALAVERRVLLVDLPGHGRSGHPPGRYPPARLAAAVLDAMDDAGLDQAVIAGNSLGGATAVALALAAPARVRGLILMGAPGGAAIPDPLARIVSSFTSAMHLGTLSPDVLELGWSLAGAGSSTTAEAVIEQTLAVRTSAEWPLVSRALASALEEVVSWEPTLEHIGAPALVVHGEDDRVVWSSSTRRMSERLQNGTLIELEDCGHFPALECPRALLAVTKDFLSEIDRPLVEPAVRPARTATPADHADFQ